MKVQRLPPSARRHEQQDLVTMESVLLQAYPGQAFLELRRAVRQEFYFINCRSSLVCSLVASRYIHIHEYL